MATYDATLIYLDEPQLITLKTGKTRVVAVATPSDRADKAPFLAVTVSPSHWEQYLDGNVDLRFLFTFPLRRLYYTFDLMTLTRNEVNMDPYENTPPDEWLPLQRVFSSLHTHPYLIDARASDETRLFIDGEWDMPEFGEFYQQYSSIYAFKAAVRNANDETRPAALRGSIKAAFRDRPFKGGFSYVHFYSDLGKHLPRDERIGLERIAYASPGNVDINGDAELLAEVKKSISNYLIYRKEILEIHRNLKKFLSDRHYSTMSAENYVSIEAVDNIILGMARSLNNKLDGPQFDELLVLAEANALVVAKLALSYFRRVEDAATFFAEGRMAFG